MRRALFDTRIAPRGDLARRDGVCDTGRRDRHEQLEASFVVRERIDQRAGNVAGYREVRSSQDLERALFLLGVTLDEGASIRGKSPNRDAACVLRDGVDAERI